MDVWENFYTGKPWLDPKNGEFLQAEKRLESMKRWNFHHHYEFEKFLIKRIKRLSDKYQQDYESRSEVDQIFNHFQKSFATLKYDASKIYLIHAIKRLTDSQKRYIIASYQFKLPISTIAKEFKVSVQAVYRLRDRSLKTLRSILRCHQFRLSLIDRDLYHYSIKFKFSDTPEFLNDLSS